MKPRYKLLLFTSVICLIANIFWLFYPHFHLILFTKINLGIAFIILIQYMEMKRLKKRRNCKPPDYTSIDNN